MTEKNRESIPENEEIKQTAGKQPNGFLRILLRVLTWIFTLLLVALAVVAVLNRDQLNLDSVKRYLSYQALERTEEGLGVEFPIGQENQRICAALDDSLLLCSENRIQIYSDGGTSYVDLSVALAQPVVCTEGNYALVYDAGGNDLYLFSNRQLIFQYSTEASYALISARVNAKGWLTVVEQASGYKAWVTVYDANQERVVTEKISSRFVMDAVVSPDNKQLAALTIGQDGSDFVSTLTLYNCTNGEEEISAVISNEPVIDLRWDENGIWLQEENGVRRLDAQCAQVGEWMNASLYLRGYSLSGSGFAVEYLSYYRSGSLGQVIVLDSSGQTVGTLNVTEEILSITAAGRYIALLTNSALTIYTSDLTEYASLPNTGGIQKALVRSDGTAVLVTAESASVFLP